VVCVTAWETACRHPKTMVPKRRVMVWKKQKTYCQILFLGAGSFFGETPFQQRVATTWWPISVPVPDPFTILLFVSWLARGFQTNHHQPPSWGNLPLHQEPTTTRRVTRSRAALIGGGGGAHHGTTGATSIRATVSNLKIVMLDSFASFGCLD
jgi:hypothetical protein